MTELEKTAEVIVDFKKDKNNSKKNIIALFLGKESMVEANKIFKENNIVFFNNFEDLIKVI